MTLWHVCADGVPQRQADPVRQLLLSAQGTSTLCWKEMPTPQFLVALFKYTANTRPQHSSQLPSIYIFHVGKKAANVPRGSLWSEPPLWWGPCPRPHGGFFEGNQEIC